MVGHELVADDLDGRVMDGDLAEFLQDGLPQLSGVQLGGLVDAVARDVTQQGAAPLHDKGNHVDAAALVVVTVTAALHRGDSVAHPFGFLIVVLHEAKLLPGVGTGKRGRGFFLNKDAATQPRHTYVDPAARCSTRSHQGGSEGGREL